MDTEDKLKAAFDGVDMRTPITEPVIAELLRNFAVAIGKVRLADEATEIAANLVDVGVDTYGDLRMMTCQVYVDYCGVKPMDAVRLVAHFAQPEKAEKVANAPRGVAKSVRTRTRFVVVNRETALTMVMTMMDVIMMVIQKMFRTQAKLAVQWVAR